MTPGGGGGGGGGEVRSDAPPHAPSKAAMANAMPFNKRSRLWNLTIDVSMTSS
jgi:hypothetical protein